MKTSALRYRELSGDLLQAYVWCDGCRWADHVRLTTKPIESILLRLDAGPTDTIRARLERQLVAEAVDSGLDPSDFTA